jgi:hypothetical protein
MKLRNRTWGSPWPALVAVLLGLALLAPSVGAKDAAAGGRTFDTPREAAEALIEAARNNDDAALLALMGSKAKDLVMSGRDPVVSQERAEFAAAAKEKFWIETNGDGTKTLTVGHDAWPVPFPLVQAGGKWRFDVEAGREELLARRIGRNELRAIELCRIYSNAQIEYATLDHDGDGVREYARKLRSTAGKKDGLYWETGEDEEVSPLGPLVASWHEHIKAGLSSEKKIPVGGYYFRILEGQGRAAPGGRHSYVINGNMIAGFALVAYPAVYHSSGIKSFLISHHGKIYERDLGRCTPQLAHCMIGFNPTTEWVEVTEE